jgi:hypothetical protein
VEHTDPIQTLDNQSEGPDDVNTPKKTFVTPQVSVPVDVLEATTYFQLTDSGATN